MSRIILFSLLFLILSGASGLAAAADSPSPSLIYNPGQLIPIDSTLKVSQGDKAPDFTLRSLGGSGVTLSDFQGSKNVVLSFVPAAWTPVCSDQWPGYNIAREYFLRADAVLLGITVDNLPTLHAWTSQMGKLWFEVLSDFWPHGGVADSFGLLRRDGTSERALVFIDKAGIINAIHVFDINTRPPLELIVQELDRLGTSTNRK